jgi:hypothetical protein
MFLGRILAYNAVDTQEKVCNIVDAFVHQAPLMWKDKKHKELTGYGQEGIPVKRKDVVNNPMDIDDGDEKGKSVQKDIEEETMDTDDELDAMYSMLDLNPIVDEGEDENDI